MSIWDCCLSDFSWICQRYEYIFGLYVGSTLLLSFHQSCQIRVVCSWTKRDNFVVFEHYSVVAVVARKMIMALHVAACANNSGFLTHVFVWLTQFWKQIYTTRPGYKLNMGIFRLYSWAISMMQIISFSYLHSVHMYNAVFAVNYFLMCWKSPMMIIHELYKIWFVVHHLSQEYTKLIAWYWKTMRRQLLTLTYPIHNSGRGVNVNSRYFLLVTDSYVYY